MNWVCAHVVFALLGVSDGFVGAQAHVERVDRQQCAINSAKVQTGVGLVTGIDRGGLFKVYRKYECRPFKRICAYLHPIHEKKFAIIKLDEAMAKEFTAPVIKRWMRKAVQQ